MNPVSSIVVALGAVLLLVVIAAVGAGALGLELVFGAILPYLAIVAFLAGFVYRIVQWAKSPVPFRIPTSCGQQESLPWIKQDKLDNPSCGWGVLGRMALEVLFFRSLFRNTKAELQDGSKKLVYGSDKWLWAAGLAFHWTFLVVFLRHMRLFAEPVPGFVHLLESFDGFFQITVPAFFITDAIILGALTYLFIRRVVLPEVRAISLPADFFPLFLLLGVATTGVLMRYIFKVDISAVKKLSMGLLSFSFSVPEGIGVLFYIHLFLVCTLFAYFPFSKLMHMGGVFMSPTRNLANNNRKVRHVNPWDYPVKTHTYDEYEEEFRKLMQSMDIPVEKE
ncbi:MAG: menaquinol oxidoreductase [Myxococcales bacterium]|nr:MAG: menaquinol oxidoreductase [Myxococcales bacterium]